MKIIVYTQTGCHWCDKVKVLLSGFGYQYEERNIETDQDAFNQAIASQFRTMPQVVIDEVLVGGFETTSNYFSKDL